MEPEITGHRLHPGCTLVLKADGDAFNCAACMRESSKAYRYSCEHLDLHGECVTSPDSFSFWGHPHHPLELVNSGPDLAATLRSTRPEVAKALVASSPAADGRIPVYCNMCTNEIRGMHYRCAPCGVFMHPVCVQLPVTVRSAAHPEHELTLICSWPSMCVACTTPSTWAYRCFRCLLLRGFHANCIPEYHHLLGAPYSAGDDPNGVPDRTRRFGIILRPNPPPPPKMFVDQGDPFVGMNPLGIMDPFNMPRRGPSDAPSVQPDPCGGAFVGTGPTSTLRSAEYFPARRTYKLTAADYFPADRVVAH